MIDPNAMTLIAIVQHGARTPAAIRVAAGLKMPVIWTAIAALKRLGFVETGCVRHGDVWPTEAGESYARAIERDRHGDIVDDGPRSA